MKKIISLVVMATMLCTLFAVNVSAAVPVGDVLAPVADISFDVESGANFWTYTNGIGPGHSKVTATLLEEGAVLSVKPDKNANDYVPNIVGIENFTFPENYEFSFRARNMSSTRCGFMVWIADRTISSNGAYLAIGSGETTSPQNVWFEYKITVRNGEISVARRNVTADGAWTACEQFGEFFGEDGKYRVVTSGWAANGINGVGFGFGSCNWITAELGAGWADDFEFQFSDVALKEIKEVPSEGVRFVQDFETSGWAESEGGIAEVVTDNGNKVGRLDANSVWGGIILAKVAATGTWSDISFGDTTLTFDAAWKNDAGSLTICIGSDVTDDQFGGTIQLNVCNNEADKDKWYTYKIACSGWGQRETEGRYRNAVVYRKEVGGSTWTQFTDCDVAAGVDSQGGNAGTVIFGTQQVNSTGLRAPETEYWIDNLTIAKKESYSLPAVSVAGSDLNVTVAYENGAEIATAKMTPVLATFAGSVLVDVDFAALDAAAGQIEADLSASVLGADKAELYVWDGIGTAKPIKAAAIDLGLYLD